MENLHQNPEINEKIVTSSSACTDYEVRKLIHSLEYNRLVSAEYQQADNWSLKSLVEVTARE